MFYLPIDHKNIALAVSGGTDSLAMMHFMYQATKGRIPSPRVMIFTIDHGLRPESADEVLYVQKMAYDYGFECQIMTLDLSHHDQDVQNRARLARYHALSTEAKKYAVDVVYLAHHLDDMCETMLSRLLHQSAWAGLRPMATYFHHQGMLFHRPLLKISRKMLEDYCTQNHLSPIHDPSNQSFTYERTHIRQFLQKHPDIKEKIISFSEKTSVYHAWEQCQTDIFLNHHCYLSCYGYATLNRKEFDCLSKQTQLSVINRSISYVSPKSFVQNTLIPDQNITIAGVYCHFTKDYIGFFRENRSLPIVSVRAGERILFDNRFDILCPEAGMLLYGLQEIKNVPFFAKRFLPILTADNGRVYDFEILKPVYKPADTSMFERIL